MNKLILISVALFIFFASAFPVVAANPEAEQKFEAKVVKITDSGKIIEADGSTHQYQKLELIATSKENKGEKFTVENGKASSVGSKIFKVGDDVVLSVIPSVSGERIISIYDYVRRTPLYILALIFALLTIFIGGKRGASSLLGMILTFVIIFTFVLPQLSSGENPLVVTFIASIIVIPLTFALSHGINRKTISAVIGTFIALIIAGILAQIFIESTHLTGFASEEAGFLDVMKKGALDIKGLVFAGIVIALLGILEDITISQSAIVFQLKKANHTLSFIELFKRAMDIGQDHIASMANTLILVYAGASLPLLLLFTSSPLPFSQILNTEMIAEEVVRTLIASIALILAVPITTLISAIFAENTKLLSKFK